ADVAVTERERFAKRQLEDLLRPRRERDLPGADLVALADDPPDLVPDGGEPNAERLENARPQPLLLPQQPEQEVLGADVVVLERPRFVLRQHDDLTCRLGEALEHAASLAALRVRG